MGFGHEKRDVCHAAIDYVGWAYRFCDGLPGHRNAKDPLLRASQAIPLNLAEGNGKATEGDRRRYLMPNKPDAPEPAIASQLHVGCHWRGSLSQNVSLLMRNSASGVRSFLRRETLSQLRPVASRRVLQHQREIP
jgi:hypothetical protein